MDDARTLGRYRLLRKLGEGGMGEVFLGSVQGPAGFEKLVAIKVLGERFNEDPERTRELLREALIGVQLDHQNVVPILDLASDAGRYFIAMEYVRGFSVAQVIEYASRAGERVPIESVVHTVWSIADALDYVHTFATEEGPLRLIHGDVTASNILLAVDGRIKLSDFGVAQLAHQVRSSGALVGKLNYLPPEAFDGAAPAQAWDVYALGAVLYEALAGRRAFPGARPQDVRESIELGPDPLGSIRSDCHPFLRDLAERAIHRDPDQRFASAAALRDAIDRGYPRLVEDAEKHRAYLRDVYAREGFIEMHGELPTTGRVARRGAIESLVDADADTGSVPVRAVRVGLSPAHGAVDARRHGEQLATVLARRLGRPVRAVALADYEELLGALTTGEIDLAWAPPAAYIEAAGAGATLVATARRAGRASYDSAIIVKAGSALRGIADLRDVSMAWVDAMSAAGYFCAAAEISRQLGDPDDALGAQHFHGSHEAVCEAVANGWADAGATYAVRSDDGTVLAAGWLDHLGDRAGAVTPIAFIGPIPGDAIVARAGLSERFVDELLDVLIGLSEDPEGRQMLAEVFNADGMVAGDPAAYDAFRLE